MSVDLYYFSGSGNTLFVAKELNKRLPGSRLIPIIGLLSNATIETEATSIGIISPLHGMTLPVPVEQFLRKLCVQSAKYIFAVTTRGGTISKGFRKMERMLRQKNKRLDASFMLNMPSNDPKFKVYEVPTARELEIREKILLENIDLIKESIIHTELIHASPNDGANFPYIKPINYLLERLVLLGMALVKKIGLNDYFYPDAKCTGCGTCESVCLSGKIKFLNGLPEWQRKVKCYFCYACLNYCPKGAIQIKSKPYMKSYTEHNVRYSHPYATANEIAQQKRPHIGSGA
jgi:ferredoxin